jgi:hypothetical protein
VLVAAVLAGAPMSASGAVLHHLGVRDTPGRLPLLAAPRAKKPTVTSLKANPSSFKAVGGTSTITATSEPPIRADWGAGSG